MKIEIGNRLIKEINQDELIGLCLIEGVIPSLEYWKKPIVTNFDSKMFSDTIVIDYHSLRIDDNVKSGTIIFYLNHKDFSFHFRREKRKETEGSNRLKIESLKYLISLGFNIPLY